MIFHVDNLLDRRLAQNINLFYLKNVTAFVTGALRVTYNIFSDCSQKQY